jgi:hypothetical protein
VRTFYIAGSSTHRDHIAGLGNELYHYGLRWFADWNWPRFKAKEMTDPLQWAGVTCGDIGAAVGADLFVLFVRPDGPRSMAWAEFGARISHAKEAHVIHHGYEDVFWGHPCVRKHKDWGAFLEWLVSDRKLELCFDRKLGRVDASSGRLPKT